MTEGDRDTDARVVVGALASPPVAATGPIPPSELVGVGVAVIPATISSTPERIGDLYEMTWMIAGEASVRLGDDRYGLPWRMAVLTRPGDRISFAFPDRPAGSRVHVGFVHFRLPGSPVRTDWPRARALEGDSPVLSLMEHILWLGRERPADWWDTAHEALRLAVRVFASGHSGREAGDGARLPDAVLRAMDLLAGPWIDGSPLPTPTLDDLARAAGVSRDHLCRVFAREVGASPLATLRLIRLGRAATLLRGTSMRVAEIGRATGFPSEFHFSRTFHRQFGLSPSAYRASGIPGALPLPPAILRLTALLSAG